MTWPSDVSSTDTTVSVDSTATVAASNFCKASAHAAIVCGRISGRTASWIRTRVSEPYSPKAANAARVEASREAPPTDTDTTLR